MKGSPTYENPSPNSRRPIKLIFGLCLLILTAGLIGYCLWIRNSTVIAFDIVPGTILKIDGTTIEPTATKGSGVVFKRLDNGVHRVEAEIGRGSDSTTMLILPRRGSLVRDNEALSFENEKVQGNAESSLKSRLAELVTLRHDINGLIDVAFNHSSEKLVSTNRFGEIYIWQIENWELENRFTQKGHLLAFDLSPSEDIAVLSLLGTNGGLFLLDLNTGEQTEFYTTAQWDIGFDSSGRFLAGAGIDGSVRVWNSSDLRQIQELSPEDGTGAVEFTPDSEHILNLSSPCRTSSLLDLKTGSHIWGDSTQEMLLETPTISLRMHPQGQGFAEAINGVMTWRSLETGQLLWQFPNPHEDWSWPGFLAMDISPSGESVALTGDNGRIWLLSTLDGSEIARIDGGGAAGSAVSFNPNGTLIARADEEGVVKLWSMDFTPSE